MTFASLDDILNLAEGLLKYTIKQAIENNLPELEYLEKYNQNQLISELKKIINIFNGILVYSKKIFSKSNFYFTSKF